MTVKPGLEVLLERQPALLAGRRIGLVVSASSVDSDLNSSVERLRQHPTARLAALFGPEHGVRGSAEAGDPVATATDPHTGLPVYSLYGDTKKPAPEMLADLDALVFDLQDGGVRFYTYLSTLVYVVQAAAEAGLPLIVLDRPNPINGWMVEGPLLDPAYESFVGLAPVTIRHGMTAGELALLINGELGLGCDLRLVPMAGWQRSMWLDDTGLPFVPPSPNLPTLAAMTLYPGTCLVEGTNLSEGRGTTRPFEYVGAPWIDAEALAADLNMLDLPGARFRPVYFTPTFSKHQGQLCRGVHIYVRDRNAFRALETALSILALVKASYPGRFDWQAPWTSGGHRPIDLLTGGSQTREHLDAGNPVSALIQRWESDVAAFQAVRANYLLYAE